MARKKKELKENSTDYSAKLSELQVKYAKILYEQGVRQERIAQILGVNQQTISYHKVKQGDWDQYRLPESTPRHILGNLIQLIMRFQISLLSGQEPDHTRSVLNIHKLISSLREIQELVDEVSYRDRMLSMKDFIEWLGKQTKTFNTPYEAAQAFYDECDKALR